jgi:hypothetical protein
MLLKHIMSFSETANPDHVVAREMQHLVDIIYNSEVKGMTPAKSAESMKRVIEEPTEPVAKRPKSALASMIDTLMGDDDESA